MITEAEIDERRGTNSWKNEASERGSRHATPHVAH